MSHTKLKFKDNSGFTLLEVIVSLFLIGLVGLTISSIYTSVIRNETKKNELNEFSSIISNIHELYLSNPENWQINLYGLYQIEISKSLGEKQSIYFNHNFEIVNDKDIYELRYDYILQDGIYNLYISSISKRNDVIIKSINLGRWKTYD